MVQPILTSVLASQRARNSRRRSYGGYSGGGDDTPWWVYAIVTVLVLGLIAGGLYWAISTGIRDAHEHDRALAAAKQSWDAGNRPDSVIFDAGEKVTVP